MMFSELASNSRCGSSETGSVTSFTTTSVFSPAKAGAMASPKTMLSRNDDFIKRADTGLYGRHHFIRIDQDVDDGRPGARHREFHGRRDLFRSLDTDAPGSQ